MIKSVSYDQEEILENIIRLYIPSGGIECDSTFGNGNFYKRISVPRYAYDLNPRNGAEYGDSRNLPLADESISSLMFDPPFLATKGKSLQTDKGNIINRRFGVYPTEKELHDFYTESIKEGSRVLKKDGILIVKCQDKVSSGKQYMSHVYIFNEATRLGFVVKDLFILLAKNRWVADWQKKNQQHARKYHCYFWVFQKKKGRVKKNNE